MNAAKQEQWDALTALVEVLGEDSDLAEILDYAADVWNGGHEQWLDHTHDHDRVPGLLDEIEGCGAGAALARAALRVRVMVAEEDAREVLDDLDTVFYAGLDEQLVAALATAYLSVESKERLAAAEVVPGRRERRALGLKAKS